LCDYPSYTTLVGSPKCDGFNLQFTSKEMAIALSILFTIFVFTVMQAGDKKYAAIVIFLLPTVDVISDIAYW